MGIAQELLTRYVGAIRDPAAAADLFMEDGAIELPYLESLGLPWRVAGRSDIRQFLTNLLHAVPSYEITDLQIFMETDDQVFGEYRVDTVTADGRPFIQAYAGRLVARQGRIQLVRESLDVVRAARAMLPGGVADLPH